MLTAADTPLAAVTFVGGWGLAGQSNADALVAGTTAVYFVTIAADGLSAHISVHETDNNSPRSHFPGEVYDPFADGVAWAARYSGAVSWEPLEPGQPRRFGVLFSGSERKGKFDAPVPPGMSVELEPDRGRRGQLRLTLPFAAGGAGPKEVTTSRSFLHADLARLMPRGEQVGSLEALLAGDTEHALWLATHQPHELHVTRAPADAPPADPMLMAVPVADPGRHEQ